MDRPIHARIEELNHLELALLLSTVAEVHCIFTTAVESLHSLQEELRLSSLNLFGLDPAIIPCTPQTTIDAFNSALLTEPADPTEDHSSRGRSGGGLLREEFQPTRQSRSGDTDPLDGRRIADVVIATGLDTATDAVQIQALELLKSGRIFTRSAMHVAPKGLRFVAVLSHPGARLNRHLNDMFCMSHFHDEADGFAHVDGDGRGKRGRGAVVFPAEDVGRLMEAVRRVEVTAEIAQFLHDIAIFMRNSRYVRGGATATATRQLRVLSMALAPLHDLDYVSPSLVALAARKVYAHRLVLATADSEKSLLWGSDPRAVQQLLDGVTVEDVIEDVLASVETPL
jgi:hypothetical protein